MHLRVLTLPLSNNENAANPAASLEALQAEFEITRYEHYVVDLADGPAVVLITALRERQTKHPDNSRSTRTRRHRDQLLAEMTDEQRDRFEKLRAWRKMAAQHEGLPVYAVTNNEQLAEAVKIANPSLTRLGEIRGLGSRKLERFGAAILEILQSPASSARTRSQDDE